MTEFTMERETASALLSDKCELLRKLFDECVDISKQSGVTFELPWGGEGTTHEEGYSMGGFYLPVEDKWNNQGWNPSNQSC
jgi:hypothetical protein